MSLLQSEPASASVKVRKVVNIVRRWTEKEGEVGAILLLSGRCCSVVSDGCWNIRVSSCSWIWKARGRSARIVPGW